jgi:hypothetical protein
MTPTRPGSWWCRSRRGYNPPKGERILEWHDQQPFPSCPSPDDPDACNVYRELDLLDEILENIQHYLEFSGELGPDAYAWCCPNLREPTLSRRKVERSRGSSGSRAGGR